MLAGEAKPYLEEVQHDLAQEQDPQLRNWYETEVSLTSDYRDAQALNVSLSGLHAGLRQLIESRTEAAEVTAKTPEATPETATDNTEMLEDDYLDPVTKKSEYILGHLYKALGQYDIDCANAKLETKQSKRQKKRSMADNHFLRNFSEISPDSEDILHDADALSLALIPLLETRPALAEFVISSQEQYLHKNGVEFSSDYQAFAKLIACSTNQDMPSVKSIERLLTAVFDKKDFIGNPLAAVQLHINLAHAIFEDVRENNLPMIEKIIETSYLRNDVIPNKVAYFSAVNSGTGLPPSIPITSEAQNAKQAFYQARSAYQDQIGVDYFGDMTNKYRDQAKLNVTTKNLWHQLKMTADHLPADLKDPEMLNFLQNPQHFEYIMLHEADTEGEILFDLPDKFGEVYRSSDLYRKRRQQLVPRAMAHDRLISAAQKYKFEGYPGFDVDVQDTLISPGVAVSTIFVRRFLAKSAKPADIPNRIFSDTLQNDTLAKYDIDELEIDGHVEGGRELLHLYFSSTDITHDGKEYTAMSILRPAVPEDSREADPIHGLIGSLGLESETDQAHQERVAELNQLKQAIRSNQHFYPGRRAIKFNLPDSYQKHGFKAVEMRRHDDGKHLIVTTRHDRGSLDFTFSDNLDYQTKAGEDPRINTLLTTFEEIVVKLYGEWACRPVVDTSEGQITVEDSSSRVNLGFLRYVPVGASFRNQQRLLFKREQRGDLEAESRRRAAQDPKGLGRRSTYVKENYDPSRPPLEVYYDTKVLPQV